MEVTTSNHYRNPAAGGVRSTDIWRSRRVNGAWATAEVLPAPISTDASEIYPVIVADGSLYFSSNRPGGLGRTSLYRAQRLADGTFAPPVMVPPPINTEFGVGDTFVSPDVRYTVLSSNRPPNLGGSDLFVSFRQTNGGWGEPAHLGSVVNSDQTDFCPFVTPDGKYLFYSRRHTARPSRRWETCTGSM
jgi:WD40-like Beta Propeller Repeat